MVDLKRQSDSGIGYRQGQKSLENDHIHEEPEGAAPVLVFSLSTAMDYKMIGLLFKYMPPALKTHFSGSSSPSPI